MRTDNPTDSVYRKLFYDIYQCKNPTELQDQKRILDQALSTWKGELFRWNHLSFALNEREFQFITDLKPYAMNLLEHSNAALTALSDAVLEHSEGSLSLISAQIHLNLIIARFQIRFIGNGFVTEDRGAQSRGQLQSLSIYDLLDQCWNIQGRLDRALTVIKRESSDEYKSRLLSFYHHSHHKPEHSREKDEIYFASYEQKPTDFLAWEFQHIDREFTEVLEDCLKLAHSAALSELYDHILHLLLRRRYAYRDTKTVEEFQKYTFSSLISYSSSSDEVRLNQFKKEIQAQKMTLDYLGICQTVPKKNNTRNPEYSLSIRKFILLYRDLCIFLSMTNNQVSKEGIRAMKHYMDVITASHMSWAKIEFYNLLLTHMLLRHALDEILIKPVLHKDINDHCSTILSALLQKMIISSAELCASSTMANIPISLENLTFSQHFSGVIVQFCQLFTEEYSAFFSIVAHSVLIWLESKMFSIRPELKKDNELKKIKDPSLKKIADFYLKLSQSENPKSDQAQSTFIDSYCEIIRLFTTEKHTNFSGLMPISMNLFWQYFTERLNKARTEQGARGLLKILENKHQSLDEFCRKKLSAFHAPAPKANVPIDDDALLAELEGQSKKKTYLKANPSKSTSKKKKTKKKKKSAKKSVPESTEISEITIETPSEPESKTEEPEFHTPSHGLVRDLHVNDKNARRVLYYLQARTKQDGLGKPFIYGGYVRDSLFQELHHVAIQSHDVDICVDLDTQSLWGSLKDGLTAMQASACIAMGPEDKIYGFKIKFEGFTDVDVSSLRETREDPIEVALLKKASTFNFSPNRLFYSPIDKILYDLTDSISVIQKKSFPFLDQHNNSQFIVDGSLSENLYLAMDLISKSAFFGLKIELDDRAVFLSKLSDLRNRFEYLRINNPEELNKQRTKVYKPFRKLFCRGYALQAFRSCQEYDCFTLLFPSLANFVLNPVNADYLKNCCEQVDKTYQDKPELKLAYDYLSVSYLLALFFYHSFSRMNQYEDVKKAAVAEVDSCAFFCSPKIPILIGKLIWDSKNNSQAFFEQARSWFEHSHEETSKNPKGDVWVPPLEYSRAEL